MRIPKLTFIGDYKLRLKFDEQLFVFGEGRINLNFYNVEFILNFIPTIVRTDRDSGGGDAASVKQSIKINTINVDYSTDKAEFNLTNLYDGDEQKGKIANKFLNDNNLDVTEKLKITIAPAWSKMFVNLINNVIEKFTIEELFLIKLQGDDLVAII